LLALANNCLALPQDERSQGGIAVIPLPEYAPLSVSAYYGSAQTPIIQTAASRFAIVGIPLSATAGDALLELKAPGFSDQLSFVVNARDYPEQRITLKDTSKVSPSPEELARYAREAAEQKAVYQHFSPADGQWPTFQMPIKGEFSSPFGLKRFFNGEPRDPHAGLDIAAAEGKTAYAPADGVVVQTGDYFFNGRTVMIDHGQGIVSMLCHLSRIDVAIGQPLKRGQAIGLVGHTGRATGPHLHWGVSINNARVNPLLMLPKP
jgi:murein DD-endopeptidase MepM/ murein hydrolase activator NlpD